MDKLIETINAAVAEGATPEAKQAGVAACRMLLATLEGEPPKPAAPNPLAALAGMDVGQVLELVIGRLKGAAEAKAAAAPEPQAAARETRIELRIPYVHVAPKRKDGA